LGKEAPSRARQLIRKDDVLFSTVRTYLENIAFVPELYDGQVASTGFSVLRAKESLDPKFLFYYCLTQEFLEPLNNLQRGTSYPAVRDGDVRSQTFPLPPLVKQKNIVSKIEELFSQLDAGVAGLKRAQAELKRYRASVLKAAFEGRLVPQDPNDEPIEKLLNNKGVQVLDRNKYKPFPNSWGWTRLEYCVDILDRQRIPVNSKDREKRIIGKDISDLYPYYGATGQVGWIDDFIFDEELVLLGEDGAPFLDTNKDKAYIVKGKFWVNNHAHVIRAKSNLTTNRFLLHYLNFFDFSNYVTGTTRLKLNQTNMKSIPIIIPPIDEQNRIVEEIDRKLSIIDEINKSIKVGLQNSENLKSSILKFAFNGGLIE